MSERYGWGRITAALLPAPVAGFLAILALAGALPVDDDVRLTLIYLLAFPAAALAPCLALLSDDGRRAWLGSAGVLLLAAGVWYLGIGGMP